MDDNDGGPAFPVVTDDMPVEGSPGMSLRDYAEIEFIKAWVQFIGNRPGEYTDRDVVGSANQYGRDQADIWLKARQTND